MMALGPIITEQQERLFKNDKPINGQHSCTSHVGRYFELLTKERYNAKEIKHRACSDCPDLALIDSIDGSVFMIIEVKSFRKGKGHCLLNEERMQRYEQLKIPLLYVFWVYDFAPGKIKGTIELCKALKTCGKKKYAVAGIDLHVFCRKNLKLEKYIGGPGANPERGFNFYRVKEKHLKKIVLG